MANPLDPALQAIRVNIDELNQQIKGLERQRDRLIKARDLLAPEPRTHAARTPAKRGPGRPPGRKGATIRQELHKRLAVQEGPELQADVVRGLDSGYSSKVLQEMEKDGLITRHKEGRKDEKNGGVVRYHNVVTPVDRERLAAGPPNQPAPARPRKPTGGWVPDREKIDAILLYMEEHDEELSNREIAEGVGLSGTTVGKCLDILRGEHRVRHAGHRNDRGKAAVYRVMPEGTATGIESAEVASPMSTTITNGNGDTHHGAVER